MFVSFESFDDVNSTLVEFAAMIDAVVMLVIAKAAASAPNWIGQRGSLNRWSLLLNLN